MKKGKNPPFYCAGTVLNGNNGIAACNHTQHGPEIVIDALLVPLHHYITEFVHGQTLGTDKYFCLKRCMLKGLSNLKRSIMTGYL